MATADERADDKVVICGKRLTVLNGILQLRRQSLLEDVQVLVLSVDSCAQCQGYQTPRGNDSLEMF